MSDPALSVHISLALHRFDLELKITAGHQVTGVFGASGAGKSSLLQSIAGLRRGARGRIRFGEEVWLDSAARIWVPPERRGIGYVPQEGLLFPHFNVRGNLLAGAARARHNGRAPDRTLEAVCRLLELEPLIERDVATLSGGERQRVALGRAICSGARLLLLDEPLASLDLPLRRRVLPFLRRVRDEFRIPMVLVSHDPNEIQALCDEVIVLADGALVTSGPARRVLTDPRVFPLTREDGFENVLPCTLLRSGPDSAAWLSPRLSLMTPPAQGAPGDKLLVGIPARDIIIAGREPLELSAQNVFKARVCRVAQSGDFELVTARIDDEIPEIAVEVTTRACRQLALEAGREVYLIIKTANCILYQSAA